MYGLVSVLIILACIFLILIVLVQNSKGGGLASNFAASNQVMGVRKTADFLEKATWTLAGALLAFSIISSAVIPRGKTDASRSKIEDQIENAIDPDRLPSFPTTAPESNPETGESTGQ
ncbi:MAG: preprotein translocase subunit SecG [Bacteroidales bacterium]|nr:preprotein translocase subunit SecG [Bacteroidales bacterium]